MISSPNIAEESSKSHGQKLGFGRTAFIQVFVAGYYRCPASLMLSRVQRYEASRPRQVAIYVTRELTGHSLHTLGKLFNRDHSTIHHALEVVKDRIEYNPEFAAEVALLMNRLEA